MLSDIQIGEKYGRFTVVGEASRDRFGARQYRCRCECGYEANYPSYVILHRQNRYCRKCVPHKGGYPEPDFTGQVINGWEILEKADRVNGLVAFRCRCTKCGTESVHSAAVIRASRTEKCRSCFYDYHFKVDGSIARGRLVDGSEFLIDAEDMEKVSQLTWRVDKDGYIAHSNKPEKGNIMLHRFLYGVDDPKVMIDHINRNRKDCRKENLRAITPFGNSCNHSPFRTNKTGYTGVYYSKCSGRYEVKIGYDHRRILLGSTRDEEELVTLAQMYNISASFFFGDYTGALNDVPAPSDELVKQVIAKCSKYMKAPASASAFVA